MKKFFAASMAVAVSLTAFSALAADDGEKAFKACKACHKLDKNATGPMLGGVVGRAAGTAEGFAYSDAVKNSGITWTEENLAKWLDKSAGGPKAMIPGTKMAFAGLKKPEDIKAVIEYIKSAH
ncbi:MAG: hypothetical protein A2516_06100 [Alphaproteobacteria bacterium RIFOXYD12_FULL_60_8]|nr:MAG: hypothetical protein A2516_06100 [Alphaproteobacteria bacterium RIFOXYD12_FULL_60_8]